MFGEDVFDSVRAGQDDRVAVGVAQPALPVVGAAVARRWVAMARLRDVGLHLCGSGHGGVEVVGFEPQQDAVAVRFGARIADPAMVVVDAPVVKLENQRAVPHQPLIFGTAVRALAAEEALVPAATRLDVSHRDQWLGTHGARA